MNKIEKALEKAKQLKNVETVEKITQKEFNTPQYVQTKIIKADLENLKKNKIIAAFKNNKVYEYYRFLRTQILQRTQERGWNSLLITSVMPGEGKTVTAINLAITFAKEFTKTVLLVDADLRNPSIANFFGLNLEKGLSDYLINGEISLSTLLVNPGIEKLVILPGGKAVSNATEILDTPRMEALVKEVKNRYPDRYIFFDSPPVLTYADALVLSSYIDAVLLIVEVYKTTIEQVKKALELLENKPLLGIILNKMPLTEKTELYYLE